MTLVLAALAIILTVVLAVAIAFLWLVAEEAARSDREGDERWHGRRSVR